jgi:hypothetical protein
LKRSISIPEVQLKSLDRVANGEIGFPIVIEIRDSD